jgi:hypothetical protein
VSGIGIWNWNLELEFGIGIWNWNLEFGIGIWNWNLELESMVLALLILFASFS